MNTVMVAKHRRSSQQFESPQKCVAAQVEHGEVRPSEADFNKNESDLCLCRIGEGRFCVCTGSMNEGAE